MEVRLEHGDGEGLVAGRNGGVGGEDVGARHHLEGRRGIQALRGHQVRHTSHAEESRMPLVEVVHMRIVVHGEQGTHAADAEQHLLANTHHLVAAVKLGGDTAELRRVGRNIGIQKEDRYTADIHTPDLSMKLAGRQRHADLEGHVVVATHLGHGHIVHLALGIHLLLHTIRIKILLEVALAIHQAHGHERDAQVGRRLEVITRQATEAAGVDAHALVDAELKREVGHALACRTGLLAVPRLQHLCFKQLPHFFHVRNEAIVVA